MSAYAVTRMVSHPCLVSILETVPGFRNGPGFEIPVEGFGAKSWNEAESRASRVCGERQAQTGRAYRAVYTLGCDTCRVTGVKPGCKRKACPACEGRGVLPREAVIK